ncbi:Stress-associated endoplasmic reticulum protein [Pleurotus pulmonarius]
MPTEFEMRQRNAKFANAVKAGKKATNPSRQEQLAKRSPVSIWALGIIVFVVCGGILFELARIIFL